MAKYIFPVLFLVIAIFGYRVFIFSPPPVGLETRHLMVNGHDLTVEIAETPYAHERGLSGRASLAADHGMLFLFPESDVYPFWMQDMHFPLDIIWLQDNTVVDLITLPAPTDRVNIPLATPRAEADMVLEIPAGAAKEFEISIGTHIDVLTK